MPLILLAVVLVVVGISKNDGPILGILAIPIIAVSWGVPILDRSERVHAAK